MNERPKSSSASVQIAIALWCILFQLVVMTGVLSDIRDASIQRTTQAD
jgi:hypothetical protein